VNPHSSVQVEDTCQTLYAVADELLSLPVLALVRKSDEDYPAAICKLKYYMPAYSDDSTAVSQDLNQTVSESFLEANASLAGVTTYHGGLEEDSSADGTGPGPLEYTLGQYSVRGEAA